MAGTAGRVRDPIHGYVAFTAIERTFFDHSVAQRLQTISQSAAAHLVFPVDARPRFAHPVDGERAHRASRARSATAPAFRPPPRRALCRVVWSVVYTDTAAEWVGALDTKTATGSLLPSPCWPRKARGLARPLVDSVKGSRHAMEGAAAGHDPRAFRVRPSRRAVILVGGNKRGDWTGWYQRNIPLADDLYDDHLKEMS